MPWCQRVSNIGGTLVSYEVLRESDGQSLADGRILMQKPKISHSCVNSVFLTVQMRTKQGSY